MTSANPKSAEAKLSTILYPPSSILAFGTGSSVPNGTQGMQRNKREVVSQRPFGNPCASMACSE